MKRDRRFRIGTRGSPLARVQTELARARLLAAHPALGESGALSVEVIRTTGDKISDRPLADVGGKGLFTKEIDEALLDGRIDLAVHSMKDLPTWLPEGIMIGCCLERADPRDAWIGRDARRLADLAPGAVVGTASLRRAAQLLHRRPDITVAPLRGNVGTRLEKVSAGEVDGTLLALAGLRRLGREGAATAILEPDEMLPAVAQGAIGIARRADDETVQALLAPIADPAAAAEVTAERALLARLDGSCHTPIAGLARLDRGAGTLSLTGLVALPDGSRLVVRRGRGPAGDADALGADLGERLLAAAGPGFLRGG